MVQILRIPSFYCQIYTAKKYSYGKKQNCCLHIYTSDQNKVDFPTTFSTLWYTDQFLIHYYLNSPSLLRMTSVSLSLRSTLVNEQIHGNRNLFSIINFRLLIFDRAYWFSVSCSQSLDQIEFEFKVRTVQCYSVCHREQIIMNTKDYYECTLSIFDTKCASEFM